jgi:hypothetical protein
MSLADILALMFVPCQDHILKLRLVSRTIKVALESNILITINICINDIGEKDLKADFLQKWLGKVQLYSNRPWKSTSRWFNEVKSALLSGRLRPLSLLSVSVEEDSLNPLLEMLVQIGLLEMWNIIFKFSM